MGDGEGGDPGFPEERRDSLQGFLSGKADGFVPVQDQEIDQGIGCRAVAHRPGFAGIPFFIDEVENRGDRGQCARVLGLFEEHGKLLMNGGSEGSSPEPDHIRREKAFRQCLRSVGINRADRVDERPFAFAVVGARIGKDVGAGGRSVTVM